MQPSPLCSGPNDRCCPCHPVSHFVRVGGVAPSAYIVSYFWASLTLVGPIDIPRTLTTHVELRVNSTRRATSLTSRNQRGVQSVGKPAPPLARLSRDTYPILRPLFSWSLPSSSGASRASALSDWWTRLKNAETGHPYNVNYIGTMNILDAAQRAGVKRFVRLTGLSVGLSAFNPFTYLLNLMISMSIK